MRLSRLMVDFKNKHQNMAVGTSYSKSIPCTSNTFCSEIMMSLVVLTSDSIPDPLLTLYIAQRSENMSFVVSGFL